MPCHHMSQRCTLCVGTHAATDCECPVHKSLFKHHLISHQAPDPLFPSNDPATVSHSPLSLLPPLHPSHSPTHDALEVIPKVHCPTAHPCPDHLWTCPCGSANANLAHRGSFPPTLLSVIPSTSLPLVESLCHCST